MGDQEQIKKKRRAPTQEDLQAELADQINNDPSRRVQRLLGRATKMVEKIEGEL